MFVDVVFVDHHVLDTDVGFERLPARVCLDRVEHLVGVIRGDRNDRVILTGLDSL